MPAKPAPTPEPEPDVSMIPLDGAHAVPADDEVDVEQNDAAPADRGQDDSDEDDDEDDEEDD